jgi:hypothetical protein
MHEKDDTNHQRKNYFQAISKHREGLTSAILIVFIAFIIFWRGSDSVFQCTLSVDSIFAGTLALAGFLFTARTFVTFKLIDDVYKNPFYIKNWEELKQHKLVDGELYKPLKGFDEKIQHAIKSCFFALLVIFLFSMLPKHFCGESKPVSQLFKEDNIRGVLEFHYDSLAYDAISLFVISSVVFVLVTTFFAILKIDENIKAIIKISEGRTTDEHRDSKS